MSFVSVLVVCMAGIAACAGLVFVLETLMALWSSRHERAVEMSPRALASAPVEDFLTSRRAA